MVAVLTWHHPATVPPFDLGTFEVDDFAELLVKGGSMVIASVDAISFSCFVCVCVHISLRTFLDMFW